MPTAANRLRVNDITYIVIFDGDNRYRFCCLTTIMDAYTEQIKGYSAGDTLETTYSVMALKMALKSLDGRDGKDMALIHHSDRGGAIRK